MSSVQCGGYFDAVICQIQGQEKRSHVVYFGNVCAQRKENLVVYSFCPANQSDPSQTRGLEHAEVGG